MEPAPPRTEILPDLWLDGRLALWLPEEGLLVAADLHWGYAESHRARGNLLPLWGDAEIAGRLQALLRDYQPRELLWLGDSLHTLHGQTAAEAFLRDCPVPVTLLAGNHDLRWARAGGRRAERRGRFWLHHGDTEQPAPPGCVEIIGHHHPAAAWSDGAGSRLKLPALVASPRRLVLPAFSPWAAGAPWSRPLAPDEVLWAVAPRRIFSLSRGRASPLSASA